jgi:hypothetical protein
MKMYIFFLLYIYIYIYNKFSVTSMSFSDSNDLSLPLLGASSSASYRSPAAVSSASYRSPALSTISPASASASFGSPASASASFGSPASASFGSSASSASPAYPPAVAATTPHSFATVDGEFKTMPNGSFADSLPDYSIPDNYRRLAHAYAHMPTREDDSVKRLIAQEVSNVETEIGGPIKDINNVNVVLKYLKRNPDIEQLGDERILFLLDELNYSRRGCDIETLNTKDDELKKIERNIKKLGQENPRLIKIIGSDANLENRRLRKYYKELLSDYERSVQMAKQLYENSFYRRFSEYEFREWTASRLLRDMFPDVNLLCGSATLNSGEVVPFELNIIFQDVVPVVPARAAAVAATTPHGTLSLSFSSDVNVSIEDEMNIMEAVFVFCGVRTSIPDGVTAILMEKTQGCLNCLSCFSGGSVVSGGAKKIKRARARQSKNKRVRRSKSKSKRVRRKNKSRRN